MYVLRTRGRKEQYLADLLTNTIIKYHPESARRIYVPKRAYLNKVNNDGVKVWVEERRALFTGYVFVESDQIESFNTYLYEVDFDTPIQLLGKGSSRMLVGKGAKSVIETEGTTGDKDFHYVKARIKPIVYTVNETDTLVIPVFDADMKRIRVLMGEDDYVDVSRGIKENGRVKFISGPLVGMEANDIKIFRHEKYAVVQMEFLGELRNIGVAIEVLSGADDAS